MTPGLTIFRVPVSSSRGLNLWSEKRNTAVSDIKLLAMNSKDWEEKDALSVESDIWRSKFLASSLIVDEVSRSKQAIGQRLEDMEHAAR